MESNTTGENSTPIGKSPILFDEQDVGISEFLSPAVPFTAVIKHRYTDFVVNEINLNGEVVWPPKKPVKMEIEHKEAPPKKAEPAEKIPIEISNDADQQLLKLLTAEDHTSFLRFIDELNHSTAVGSQKIDVISPEDKNDRRSLHEIIKKLSPNFDSETLDIENKKIIRVSFVGGGNKKRRVFDNKQYPGKYLEFTIFKTNIDTMGAVFQIAKFMNRKPANFGFAGNKDKRGVTCQRATIFQALEEDLNRIQRNKNWNTGIVLGDYKYVDQQLKMGDLKGNRFSMALRFISLEDNDQIVKSLKNLETLGFINYYGMQRFGSTNIKTHTVGRNILKKDWKLVVESILSQQDYDSQVTRAKEEFLKTFDFKTALKKIPPRNKLDRCLIEGLRTHGVNNFKTAFMMIPRNTRELYGHAYQSFLWNRTSSLRIKLYGRQPIVGDFVVRNKAVIAEIEEDNAEEIVKLDEEEEEKEKEKEEKKEEPENNGRRKKLPDFSEALLVLDENTVKQYKLEDVVIPLYGNEINIPENNVIGNIIKDLLKQDDITREDFINSKQEFFIRGGYRFLIAKPQDLAHDIMQFNDKDMDIMEAEYHIKEDPKSDPNGKYKAIRVKFSLNKSTYATMCVRELTQTSTSFDVQAALTKNIK
jgi:tRNA pseudouridine13 synthase